MGEELSECVCSGDCAWGLGGRHEEGDLWILCSQRCSKVYEHMLIQREDRFGITYFFNSWTAVLGAVPYTDRFVMIVIDRGIGIISTQPVPGLGQMKRKESLSPRIYLLIINKI